VTYNSKLNEDALMIRAAKRYLRTTSLMYPGFNAEEGGAQEYRSDLYPIWWP